MGQFGQAFLIAQLGEERESSALLRMRQRRRPWIRMREPRGESGEERAHHDDIIIIVCMTTWLWHEFFGMSHIEAGH